MALVYAGVTVEQREVLLRDKPRPMLQASPKGTVPVLVLTDGRVIDESADVMRWALAQNDPDGWWRDDLEQMSNGLVEENDLAFKQHLDRYKYADRHPEHAPSHYRDAAAKFLFQLEQRLAVTRYLLGDRMRFADVAIFPFVRQFAFVDKPWFDQAPYPGLQAWLQSFLDSKLFTNVMKKNPTWCEDPTDD